MIIQRLQLRNFRNYEKVSVDLDPHMNLITGKNAQGKTNLLESIVYLSLTRSHRISNDRKLIRNGEEFADISCRFEDSGIEKEIEAVIHQKGKTLMVHRQPVRKSSEFIGLLNVVMFSPDDLRLFHDQPKDRRRIMNQEITKISPVYLVSLSRYQALLKERNILLKSDSVNMRILDTLDEQMVTEEKVIIDYRRKFVDSIQKDIGTLYRRISSDQSEISIKYVCCTDDIENDDPLKEMYLMCRQRDMQYRTSTAGIHREDIRFEINGTPVEETASQGQKRMIVLAFKLALMNYIVSETSKCPVLLLDDVLSELDYEKQKRLLDMMSDTYQCLITSTEIPSFLKNQKMKEFQIINGTINPL